MKKTSLALAALALVLLWAGSTVSKSSHFQGSGQYAEGEVLVKYKDGVEEDKREKARGKAGAVNLREFKGLGIGHLKVAPGLTVEEAIDELMADPDVEYAEPNYIRRGYWEPSEYSALAMWNLAEINAPAGWDVANACLSPIAVVDSGISNHVELLPNMWQNAGETDCFDGDDNDGNGKVDDCRGWNFVDNNNDPADGVHVGHGTHVAGIIGAEGDNGGVLGVCAGGAELMALKVLDEVFDGSAWQTTGTVADEIQAIEYARKNGAKVLNLSLGGTSCSYSERRAIEKFAGTQNVVVVAAGNDKNDIDAKPEYPAAFSLPFMISVAASDQSAGLSVFGLSTASNYGYNSVDLAAPGSSIESTGSSTATATVTKSGTSMAAPHVAAVAALVNTVFPHMDNEQVRAQILGSVSNSSALRGKIATGGVLNLAAALINAVPSTPSGLSVTFTNASGVGLGWTDNSTSETHFSIERRAIGEAFFNSIGVAALNTPAFTDASPAPEAYYRVMAVNSSIPGMALRSLPSGLVGHNAKVSSLNFTDACSTPPVYYGGGGGGGCFIATAAYGSSIAPALQELRALRDRVLMKSSAGRAIVAFYYRNSPPLADIMKESPAMRATLRGALAPLVLALRHPLMAACLLFMLAAMLWASGARARNGGELITESTIKGKSPWLHNNQGGFSLMEVMVVVVILGLLVAFVAPKLVGRTDDARVTSAQMQIGSFSSALKLFRNDNGFYPTTEQGLEALSHMPSVGREPKSYRKGGYLDKVPLDPWKNPYIYISPGVQGDFDIISLGADGVEGGEDYDADITNWD